MNRKSEVLGMNFGTATNRLLRDLLFEMVVERGLKCHRCGQNLQRDSFSIDHIDPWMQADDPLKTFFDTSKIAYSHIGCNASAAVRPNKKYANRKEKSAAYRQRKYAEVDR